MTLSSRLVTYEFLSPSRRTQLKCKKKKKKMGPGWACTPCQRMCSIFLRAQCTAHSRRTYRYSTALCRICVGTSFATPSGLAKRAVPSHPSSGGRAVQCSLRSRMELLHVNHRREHARTQVKTQTTTSGRDLLIRAVLFVLSRLSSSPSALTLFDLG